MEKVEKVQKWKNIRVPETLWRLVKTAAAQKGIKIYQEIQKHYEQ